MNHVDELPPLPRDTTKLRRAIVCFRAESIEAKVDYTTWLNTWKSRMTVVSRDRGCGCCIHLFDLEGPKDAIEALPDTLLSLLQWKEEKESAVTLRR